jgi:hypothetical protein
MQLSYCAVYNYVCIYNVPREYCVCAHNARRQSIPPIAILSQLHIPQQFSATLTIEEVLAELHALNSNEDICYAEIAKRPSVARSTLSRKHRGISWSRAEAGLARCNLQPEQEAELVKYTEDLTDRKLPPAREMVQIYASDIAGHPVSESWVTRFLY